MKPYYLLILIVTPLLTVAQIDNSSGKNITVASKKNIFKDASGNIVTPQEYFALANNGFYAISFSESDSGVKIFQIDSTDLLKSLHKRVVPTIMKDLSGNNIKIPTEKKITVVNFWSTTCIPCIEEMDSLNFIVRQFPNVKFIAISPDSISKTEKFLSEKTFDYDIIPECQVISSFFYVNSYPTHFVYDKNGILQDIIIGKAPRLIDLIKSLN